MRTETNKNTIERLMTALGQARHGPGRIFFVGGVSAVLLEWRSITVDVDLKLDPEPAGIFDALPKIKDDLNINIELASPDHFIPTLPGWQERSIFISRYGKIDFYHFDFYSQALAKVERFHARDAIDIKEMFRRGFVKADKLLKLFDEIEPELKRFPAIDPNAFRERLQKVITEQRKSG